MEYFSIGNKLPKKRYFKQDKTGSNPATHGLKKSYSFLSNSESYLSPFDWERDRILELKVMKLTIFILCSFLSLGLSVSSWAEGFGTCGGGCDSFNDCPNHCKECVNLGNGLECSTCCVHDEEDCTSPCQWRLGIDGNMQCQNPGVDCSGVSEMPAQKKGLIWALLGSLIAGGLFWRQRSRKIKIKSV